MKTLALHLTEDVAVVIFLCKTVKDVHKQKELMTGDCPAEDEHDCSAFMTHGPTKDKYYVVMCLSESLFGSAQNLIHEAHHATDELWRQVRKNPKFKNVDGTEYRAYLIQDLVTLFNNWKADHYRISKRLMRNMILPEVDLGWGGIRKKRGKKS